jgi:hypothetical protein
VSVLLRVHARKRAAGQRSSHRNPVLPSQALACAAPRCPIHAWWEEGPRMWRRPPKMPSAAWQAPRPRVIVRFFRKATCGLPAITFCCTWMNIGRPPPPTPEGTPAASGTPLIGAFLAGSCHGSGRQASRNLGILIRTVYVRLLGPPSGTRVCKPVSSSTPKTPLCIWEGFKL